MTVVTPFHQICELASRASGGIEVALLWNRRSNELRVCVTDFRTDTYFEIQAGRDNALDVFYHPYAYSDTHRISAEPALADASNPDPPLPRAA